MGSMIRGYDTSALFREDTILRIQHLTAEIAELQKEMERRQKEVAASEEQLEQLKKDLGLIDSPKTGERQYRVIGE